MDAEALFGEGFWNHGLHYDAAVGGGSRCERHIMVADICVDVSTLFDFRADSHLAAMVWKHERLGFKRAVFGVLADESVLLEFVSIDGDLPFLNLRQRVVADAVGVCVQKECIVL